jgi:PAS domain S-box-containing protein
LAGAYGPALPFHAGPHAFFHTEFAQPERGAADAGAGVRPREHADAEFYRAVFESSRDCFVTLSPDGGLLSISDSGCEFLGARAADTLVGTSWVALWREGDREAAQAAVAAAAAGGRGRFTGACEVNGAVRWWDVVVTPMRDEARAVRRLLAVSRDVTDQRLAEHEVRQSREQLQAFVESAAIGLHRVGPDGTILWANKAELESLGYAADEYIGQPIQRFHADQAVIADILTRLGRGECLRDYPARMIAKDGSFRDVMIDSCVRWKAAVSCTPSVSRAT